MKRRGEFLRLQGEGAKFRSRFFLVAVSRRQEEGPGRLGITVTTKVDKRAVRRNLLKRRVRELYRAEPTLRAPFDVVVIARTGATDLARDEVERELCYLFRKAKRELPRP